MICSHRNTQIITAGNGLFCIRKCLSCGVIVDQSTNPVIRFINRLRGDKKRGNISRFNVSGDSFDVRKGGIANQDSQ